MEYEIKIGQLKIDVLGAEHYCTVCSEFTWKCYRRHRSGNFYVLRVSIHSEEPVLLLLSRGEFKEINSLKVENVLGGIVKAKMSGTKIYSRGKITAAGWISFESAVMRIDEKDVNTEQLRKDMTKDEKELLYRLIDEHKINILTKYLVALSEKHDIKFLHWFIDQTDLGVWTHLKPLLHTFVSDKVYSAGSALISFIPLSFRALFRAWDIKFNVTKAKPRIFVFNDVIEIELGKERRIYVIEKDERIAVYYRLHNTVYAHEQFRQHVHPVAQISPSYFDKYRPDLFHYRLGDILFIRSDTSANVNETQLPEWTGKLKILQGSIITDGENYYVSSDDEDIVAYHPEHGILVLYPGIYKIERVQYLQAGHD